MSDDLAAVLNSLNEKVAQELKQVPEPQAAPIETIDTPEPAEEIEHFPGKPEEATPEEENALKHGWTPRSKFTGDPADFIEAAEYMSRAPLYKQIHKLKRQNDKLEQSVTELMRNYKLAEDRGREAMKNEIMAQKQEAYLSGDIDKAVRLEQQHETMVRADVQQALNQSPVETVTLEQIQNHPAWKSFTAENPWLSATDESSLELRQKAQSFSNEFADAIGNKYSVDHIPRHIEYIKANLGIKPKAAATPKAASVMSSTGKASGGTPGRHSKYERMTSIQKAICKQMCSGPYASMSMDDYINSLDRNGSLNPE